ncbi:MAG: LPS export ABC transporter ATP-binding protein [bacterium TMED88]|nr:LPS export ABC transporter ATP-binding protein [Deltaproteobacteria bacterium]OUV36177.1 MAG: LPS export ABC transporter ATP-binding protein [bacterium TMED88]
MRNDACLSGEALSRQFGLREVVREVSLDVFQGEIVGLLGPNGAGKTTIFNMLAGSHRVTSGAVYLSGENITALPLFRRARRGITYLPQASSVFRRLTVAGNLEAVLETVESSRRRRRQRMKELLEELGLEEKAEYRADRLSGGERRRLEITRALILEPRFMLLDEPFAGIDPITVSETQKLVTSLRDRGIGVMITDHNVRETLSVCDRAYIIQDGQILKAGSPDELVKDPVVRNAYLGADFQLI